MIPLQYNVRNLIVRKTTTAASLFGIALVVFVMSSAMMLVTGIKKTLGKAGATDCAIVLRVGSREELNSGLAVEDVGKILVHPAVRRVNGEPEGVGELVTVGALPKVGTGGFSNVLFRGTTEAGLRFRPSFKIVEGVAPKPGTSEAVVGAQLRGRFTGLRLGETFEVTKNRSVKVVGIFSDEGSAYESEVWFDREFLASASGRTGTVGSVRVHLTSSSAFTQFKQEIEADKRLGVEVTRESEFFERQSDGMAFLMGFMGGMLAVFCSIGAMIGAMITMYSSVANRQREIGTLRGLGFRRKTILLSFLFESVVLSIGGGLLGALASLSMGFVKFSMINTVSWSEVVFRFEPTPQIIVTALVAAAGMGVAGGFFPALRASRISAIDAMRA